MRLLLVLLLLLSGCGGGSHAYTFYMPAEPTALRTDLFFGYYLNQSKEQALETADHTNLVHEGLGYNGRTLEQVIDSMRAHGKATMLQLTDTVAYMNWPNYVPRPDADIEARASATFDALRDAGLLAQVVALYPIDEPEAQHLTDAQVTNTNAVIRRVMARYPELASAKLAVIYGTNRGFARGSPGFASYDWIGADDYDMGPGILTSPYWLDMMAALSPSQRVMLIPGGASPWRTDPEAFRRYAHNESRVVGILPFLWHHPEAGHESEGIGDNGMAESYRALGRELAAKGPR
jgi:hypothetical protein